MYACTYVLLHVQRIKCIHICGWQNAGALLLHEKGKMMGLNVPILSPVCTDVPSDSVHYVWPQKGRVPKRFTPCLSLYIWSNCSQERGKNLAKDAERIGHRARTRIQLLLSICSWTSISQIVQAPLVCGMQDDFNDTWMTAFFILTVMYTCLCVLREKSTCRSEQ